MINFGLSSGLETKIVVGGILVFGSLGAAGLSRKIENSRQWVWPYFWTLLTVIILQDIMLYLLVKFEGTWFG